jgi:ABC-type sugar transport system ATPase subunit
MKDVTAMPWLCVRGLSKRYAGHSVFEQLDLSVEVGETLAVIGASGCGKTTLLKILAGLEPADGGTIHINGRALDHSPAQARGVVYLYQEPLLFPHLSVFENIAFGLRVRKVPTATLHKEVDTLLGELDMSDFAHRDPASLSGGQRQRVAFARALVVRPALLLLDEPFSNLDPQARAAMQQLCKRLCAAYGSTVLFVTHDLKEALIMGSRYARLAGGHYQAYADSAAFCADPATGVQAELTFWRDHTP